jgi:hypothetical protein
MTAKEDLIATCKALRRNDSRHTVLNLHEYRRLDDWKQHATKFAEALEENTVVEDLWLPRNLCADSAFQLSHFLRSSPSLRYLDMEGNGKNQQRDRDPQDKNYYGFDFP